MNHDLPTETQLGEYVIEKTLGVGGFGVTYLARDSQLGTRVAIKEYFPAAYAVRDPEGIVTAKHAEQAQKIYRWGLEQFLKEAQALAQFKHNNIVRVLRFMEANGTAYMVMEYEPGQSLGDLLQETGGTLEQSRMLQVFIPILNGLQAMHDAGLVHLDIKPDNIYLCADGRPMLIDFGSASEIAVQKATGQVAITPAYAAIEHYPDKGKRGAWTDIYSIGASMYRCLAGEPPAGAMERYKSILQYKKDPLVTATELEIDGYPEYLRDCIDWSLEIYPQKRPHSALLLQQGLMGKGRPGKGKAEPAAGTAPQAKPAAAQPVNEEFDNEGNRWVTDPWQIAKWSMAALVALLLVGAGISWFTQTKPRPVEMAQTETATESETTTDNSVTRESQADALPPEHKPITSSILPPPTRLAKRIGGHGDRVKSVVVATDGRMASADANGTVLIWKPGQTLPVATFKAHQHEINALAMSPDGKLLASAGMDGLIKLWDAESGQPRGELNGHSYAVYALDFSPDGRQLASVGKDRVILLWDLATKSIAQELSGHEAAINTVRFSSDGRMLATGGEAIYLWGLPSGQQLGKLYAHKGQIMSLDFSPDGRWLASGGFSGVIKLWDLQNDKNLSLTGAPDTVYAVRFSPDGHWLASAGSSRQVQLWSIDNGNFYQELKGHEDTVLTLGFTADGASLISGSRDHKLIRWSR